VHTKLSIITINRNNAYGLRETMASVLNQVSPEFEYIVIDGASEDESVNVIKENQEKLTYWESEPDNGIYHAMNKGVYKANGEYLLFLNSGDSLVNEFVIAETILCLAYSDLIYGNLLVSKEGKLNEHLFPAKLTFKYFLTKSLPHPCTFIRKQLFDKVGYYNEHLKIVSDWEFFAKAVCLFNCTYEHLNSFISVIDTDGISRNPGMQNTIASEVDRVLKMNFSAFIDDYKLKKNRKVYFHEKIINKIKAGLK
jgi:glycosyltransferase involved in cell wall biosynthesis